MTRDGLLIDCNGVCVQRLTAAGIAFEDLGHIFLTHEHIDHIAALPNFIHQSWVKGCLYRADNRRTHPLHFYGNAPTLRAVRALLDAVNLPGHPHMFPFEFHELDDNGGTLTAGSITLTYFPVNHGPTPCFGLTTDGPNRRLVFSADTEPVQAIYDHLRDGDILIHDCNKIDVDINREHTTWAQIEALLPSWPDVTVYLVHLPLMDGEAEVHFKRGISMKHKQKIVVSMEGITILL
ncbi:MBL fold metallo-hydrolase [Micavibrio aeruginosavorus]|uniref:Beta-lactamase domain protein n=1 Tax=Micavibrio aeruginosavorus EPB TaxID=349215 RepID=M4VEG9_9BACT|nr:MBL fold metallo-hydrolase [Micavibrio aeruginosavorus]AGH97613.1 beta-lactamase domain protein [Micavibrio aeruginosavorus EPB]